MYFTCDFFMLHVICYSVCLPDTTFLYFQQMDDFTLQMHIKVIRKAGLQANLR